MGTRSALRILVAVDGSAPARAALDALVDGPWPASAIVRVVVSRRTYQPHRRSILLAALDRGAEDAALRARRVLAPRWPNVNALVVNTAPAQAVLAEAKRFRADIIAVGWRGHGPARRLLMGSVSRSVVRGAGCSVLVVRRRSAEPMRNIVLAFDGSGNARRAVSLLARLTPPPKSQVTLVQAAQLLTPTSRGPAVGGIRGSVAAELKRINAAESRAAEKALSRATGELERNGWRTRIELTSGEPLRAVFDTVKTTRAQMLVIGARGTSGVRRLLLGSVAEGVLNHSQVPVLLVR